MPGWYPDPTRRYEFRYHNGQRWTADVSVHGQRFVENEAASQPPPGQQFSRAQQYPQQLPQSQWQQGQWQQDQWQQPGLPPFQQQYQQQYQQPFHHGVVAPRPGRGFAITAFVLGLAAVLTAWLPFVFVLAALAAIVALVFGIIALVRRSPGKPFAVWGVTLAALSLPLCAVGWHLSGELIDEFTDPGSYDVAITACAYRNVRATARGTIHNLDEVYRDYTITVEFTVDGARHEDFTTIRRVAGGSTDVFEVDTDMLLISSTTAPEVECRVKSVHKPFP